MKQIELPEEIETWLVNYMKQDIPINPEVVNQKSRMEKWWCWLVYGHLYRDGVCLRCGKKQKGTYIDIGDDTEFLKERDERYERLRNNYGLKEDGPGSKLNIDRINEMIKNPY